MVSKSNKQNQKQNNAQNNLQEIGATTQSSKKNKIAKTPKTQAQSIEIHHLKPTQSEGSTAIKNTRGHFCESRSLPGKTAKIDVEGKKIVIEADELTSIRDNEEELLDIYERFIKRFRNIFVHL